MNPFLPSDVRSLFPGAREKVYFNIAETCLIPQSTADVAHAYVEASLAGRGDKGAHRESVERCREGIANLIGQKLCFKLVAFANRLPRCFHF